MKQKLNKNEIVWLRRLSEGCYFKEKTDELRLDSRKFVFFDRYGSKIMGFRSAWGRHFIKSGLVNFCTESGRFNISTTGQNRLINVEVEK